MKNIKQINSSETSANGTHLQGYLTTTLDQLTSLLGEPLEGDGDKTTAEWKIEFEDGRVVTIYDWKLSSAPTYLYDWHVGGLKGPSDLDALEAALNLPVRVCAF